jgi:citrate lyase subunit beta/citryl-CoA lyase
MKNLHASNMMLNPLKQKHLEKIPYLKAHAITLNLEDAIAPSRKKEALENIADLLSSGIKSDAKIIIRINSLEEGGKEEIEFLNSYSFDAIRLSKPKSKEQIKKALSFIRDDKELHISLETKEAFYEVRKWRVDERFTTANLGILDLLNSLNLPQNLLQIDNPTIEYILSKFLLDCKSVGLLPVSFMYQDYKNIDGFRAWCKKEKAMGFESKACMGPAQVEVANEIFGISNDEIKRAKEIVKAFEESSKKGENGFMHKSYGFIDEPIYKDALLILKKYIDPRK